MPELWNATRTELRKQLGDPNFARLFSTLRWDEEASRSSDESTLCLCTADEMAALVVEKNHRGLIEQCASSLSGREVRVRLRLVRAPAAPVGTAFGSSGGAESHEAARDARAQLSLFPTPSLASDPSIATARAEAAFHDAAFLARAPGAAPAAKARRTYAEGVREAGVAPTSRFERFVVGKSNEFAYGACHAVSEALGQLYNPLFLYGGVGLGKTHLMQAAGLAALQANPELRVRYLSAESFVNDLIASITSRDMEGFRERHRDGVDLLLIDDIQFIAGKERTQEEFFHTFNALTQSGRQIIITSDRMPHELPELQERLVSRLTMGLIVDVQAPDFETRVAILRRKGDQLGADVPSDVLAYIARTIRSNVRELHGALQRITSYARIRRVPITVDLAREQMERVHRERESQLTPEAVILATSEVFGVSVKEIRGRRRVATVARPRNVAMYVARKHTGASFPELGQAFGGRDHTTVMSNVRKIVSLIEEGDPIRVKVEAVERKLGK